MAGKKKVLVLNGPNLNRLGKWQSEIYGHVSLEQINKQIRALAKELGVNVEIRQSNNEGELVTWIQEAPKQFRAIVINPAAYTHSSVALRDAITAAGLPTIEVHISNIYRREEFRKHSYIAGAAGGQIAGFCGQRYFLGVPEIGRAPRRNPVTLETRF